MPHASLAELKGFVGIPPADTADDVTLTLALESASIQVDQFCDQTFTSDVNPTTRLYMVGADRGRLDVDPIATLDGLAVATDENDDGTFETTWAPTDYRLEPVNAAATAVPWTRIVGLGTRWFPRHAYRPGVSVTARFGWPGGVAPAPVKNATLIQAARLWKRKDAPFGVAGSVEFGSELRLLARLDPDVEALLRPYRRQWWVLV